MKKIKHNCIIIRYGEIGLKGKNRKYFEDKLVGNISLMLKSNDISAKINKKRGRILVYSKEDILPVLKRVFGIVNLSYAYEIDADIEKIKSKTLEIAEGIDFKTFRISCQRMNKAFELKSPEIERQVGEFVFKKIKKDVDLRNPELNIQIEIAEKAYIFVEKQRSVGGLPKGVAGNVLCLIDSEKSLLAAYLMMKRGADIIPVYIKSKEKEIDISLIQKFDSKLKLEKLETINRLDILAEKTDSKAIVVSQLLDEVKSIGVETPLLRPLVGYDKKQIEDELKKIKAI